MRKLTEINSNLLFSSEIIQKFLLSKGNSSFRIIYFHMVTPHNSPYYFSSGISPVEFKRIIKYLSRYYNVISLSEAIEMIENGISLKNCLSITSDDGFVENYEYVAPILLDFKLTATFFLIDECIDNKNLMWRNKLIYIQNRIGREESKNLIRDFSSLKNITPPKKNENLLSWSYRTWDMKKKEILVDSIWELSKMESLSDFLDFYKPYLTSKQILELCNNGFEFGTHSLSHPLFSKLTFEQVEKEIIDSIDSLSEKFGKQIYHFSYPFGPRAMTQIEDELKLKYPDKLKTLLGVKNTFSNFNNPYEWERDLIEKPYKIMLFRFLLLPIIRKNIFLPFGIQK